MGNTQTHSLDGASTLKYDQRADNTASTSPICEEASELNMDGVNCTEQLQFDEALAKFNKAHALLSELPEFAELCATVLANRALVKFSIRNYEQALEDVELALKFAPHFSRAYLQRSLLKATLGLREEALLDVNKVINTCDESDMWQAFLEKARIYYCFGFFPQVKKYCEMALERKFSVTALLLQAKLHIRFKEIQEAKAFLNQIESAKSSKKLEHLTPDFLMLRGHVYAFEECYNLAMNDYQMALQQCATWNSIDRDELIVECKMKRAMLYLKLKEYGKAIQDLQGAAEHPFLQQELSFQFIQSNYEDLLELKQIHKTDIVFKSKRDISNPFLALLKKIEQQISEQRKRIEQVNPTAFAQVIKGRFIVSLRKIIFSELDLEDKIGEGSFGVVYRAKWKGMTVAAKIMKNSMMTKDIERELQIINQVRHENIVMFVGVCDSPKDSQIALVTEYADRGNLFKYLHWEKKQFTFVQLVLIALDIVQGLHYLHTFKPHTIVHRDIKSPNILLQQDFNRLCAKISDFGEGKLISSLSKKNTERRGTLNWMAPELLNNPNVSLLPSIDMYSFGIVLFEIATNHLPFSEGKYAPILNQNNIPQFSKWVFDDGERPEIPDSVDERIASLIVRCWDGNPIKRPTAEQVVTELQCILEQIKHQQFENQ